MAGGVISDLAAKALASLAKPAFKEVVSWWGARDDLKKLENTMSFIQARIRDAERCQEGENSELIKIWLRKLKQVLYRADDLFDLVLTIERQNPGVERSMLAKVGVLFSKSGPFLNSRKFAHEIKSIRKELDAIKSDMGDLKLSANFVVGLPMERLISNRQTASFVKVEDIIGRENDKNIIIGMLFDPIYDGKRITVIPIVGFGGLGKTTLAQLVFNDESVQYHFDLTEWACVPDVGDQNTVMRRVYQSLTGKTNSERLLVGQIKSGIQKSIKDKKYLLVLDDIWDENRDSWLDLLTLLQCGASGSRVIVTTRSANVAKAVGTTEAHSLGLLTTEESWILFKQFAFRSGQEESNPILTQFGKEIVDSCGNVPLAIRVVGGLLYSENSEKEWQRIRNARLSKAKLKEDDNIMQVLKLSYDYLSPALKQCFAYCSLFPKDYSYQKNHLVKLWMAQGYFDPSRLDIGVRYFMELLGRNLFQASEENVEGDILCCQMHDLVHDLAQDIAGEEMKQLVELSNQITSDGVIHLSVEVNCLENVVWEAPAPLLSARKLRSLLFSLKGYIPFCNMSTIKASSLEMLVLKFQSLRALDLEGINVCMVPNTIGKLRHLRYLNLGWNDCIRSLPNDLTRLENLQTLNIRGCLLLNALPRGFGNLANLRHLTHFMSGLSDLPLDFGKLTSLQELDVFIVGKNNGIDSLPTLNLLGYLQIHFSKWRSDAVLEAQRANLKDNQQLTHLEFYFMEEADVTPALGEMDKMLTCLQLPPNLKKIEILHYKGVEMPRRWLDGLSILVSIKISFCHNIRVIPHLSQLPHLKYLSLIGFHALEYLEDEDICVSGGGEGGKCGSGTRNVYFPSLEVLQLEDLSELKGLTKPSMDYDNVGEPRKWLFPRLLHLEVYECFKLMSMPLAPKLESLSAQGINWEVFETNLTSIDEEATSSSTLFTSLKELSISLIDDGPVSLSISSRLSDLHKLSINNFKKLQSLMLESLNPIRHLIIISCKCLTNISAGNPSALETLEIWGGNDSVEKLPQGIACLTTLQKLEIKHYGNLKQLLEEMGNLSLLRELVIVSCPKLASLPESLLGLVSLQKLHIFHCPDLKIRYEKPNGQDCQLLQHIPDVEFCHRKLTNKTTCCSTEECFTEVKLVSGYFDALQRCQEAICMCTFH